MRQRILLVSTLLALGLATTLPAVASAATAPVYQAAGPKGGMGWTTAPAQDGRFVVAYTGDARMKKDQVVSYAMLRAAEFTQESGFEWFAVIASKVREVEQGSANALSGTSGAFLNNETASTGSSPVQSASGGNATIGGGDSGVDMGPSTGGFGGGAPPPSVVEHWRPKTVEQAVLLIQMGKGDQASFPGVTKQPQIFDAKSTADELRAPPASK